LRHVKILSQHTLIGQQGINLIEHRVHDMGYWWYPSVVPEVGIDGYIEIRDSQTGRMTKAKLRSVHGQGSAMIAFTISAKKKTYSIGLREKQKYC
jgi:hypothetical protein